MIPAIFDILIIVLLAAGGLFSLLAAAGILLMPDVYTRMQAASKAVTFGATSIVLAGILNVMAAPDLVDGLVLGLLVGVGFIAAGMASDYAFCGWPRPLFFIQAGYRVTYSVVMGVILAVWR